MWRLLKKPFLLIARTSRIVTAPLWSEYRRIHQVFQHIARFFIVTTKVQLIVTAAVHRGFSSVLRVPEGALTLPFNLPALGRCQPLYILLRVCRDLWFW
jgi:hypothetical protein